MNKKKVAIIIGAGPAGLTAAYELLVKTEIKPVILEISSHIGGLSKTINYKGNRIDIGGHRFFSKSDVVMDWWSNFFPHENPNDTNLNPKYTDRIMFVRNRLSRILFLGKLFDYPVTLSVTTLRNLGIMRVLKIILSYLKATVFKRTPEKSLEDFFINRFGKTLYKLFFKSYTEKVWGVACNKISPAWGGQRIKGLSVIKTIVHAFTKVFKQNHGIAQKETETSLISRFLYPKYGPGQFWEYIAAEIIEKGGEIHFYKEVKEFQIIENRFIPCFTIDSRDLTLNKFDGDYFLSTMPVKNLIKGMRSNVPEEIASIAKGLVYRDFITVGILLHRVRFTSDNEPLKDNWIYIQEPHVKVGRVQIFNNWSPFMVHDQEKFWIGMEYFCNEGDELWNQTDKEFIDFAANELQEIKFATREDILDATVIRTPKAYPCYFGSYNQFDKIIDFVNKFDNLFLIGRNGMHKYNNSDHSMLTAIASVNCIIEGTTDKSSIWKINTEENYHEESNTHSDMS